MPTSLTLSLTAVYGFALVMARVSGALVFVPLPGLSAAPGPARVALAAGLTLALASRWPAIDPAAVSPARLAGWALAEGATGVAIGVAAAMVLEAFVLAAQILGLQAGYAYASTIDPNTEADSGVLLVFAQLGASLLFFAAGLDREVLRLFAWSLDQVPPGSYGFGTAAAPVLIRLGAKLFSVGLRLALPVVALLVMVDVALALVGRVNAQLQLLALAFPLKMLLTLVVFGWGTLLFPRLLRELSTQAWAAARQLLSP
ncbi:MAG TPA: flagellar biosynthetic protein FliR [Bryobacteraceae bacterium]|nr:flagellar biosynthetic protein FliR [Bryobacteraceae bacterium]